jgi:RNA polymerase sigma-70 factor (ECF subfamily)
LSPPDPGATDAPGLAGSPGASGNAAWGARVTDEQWLARFWAGERATLDELCRHTMTVVDGAVSRYLHGADRDTVVQTVFLKVLADEKVRRNFTGGSLRAWLGTVARNQSIDFARRRNREVPSDATNPDEWTNATGENLHARAEARIAIQRFRKEHLPEKWAPVFEARFIEQLSQREAAASLGMSRTTLAYQESRVRRLLRKFLLPKGGPS